MIVETQRTLSARHVHIVRTLGTRELPGGCFMFERAELAAMVRWGFVEARPSTLRKRRNLYRLTADGLALLAEEVG